MQEIIYDDYLIYYTNFNDCGALIIEYVKNKISNVAQKTFSTVNCGLQW